MRTSFLPVFAFLFMAPEAGAQINAGDIPAGTSVFNPGIDLILSNPFTTDSASFDVDCDGGPDIRAFLLRGEPAIDAPNIAFLHLLDPDLELCSDMAQFQRPQYHAWGQSIDCTGNFNWQSDSVNILGDFGSFSAIGPLSTSYTYVAYRMGGTQVGWIQLSFEVDGSLQVSLQIHEVLQLCISNDVDEHAVQPALTLFPDPSNGQEIHVECNDALESIEMLDAAGRVISEYNGVERTIAAPEVAGTYLVRALYADGRRSVTRLVRY